MITNKNKYFFYLLVFEKNVLSLQHENKANHNKDYSVVKTFRVGV